MRYDKCVRCRREKDCRTISVCGAGGRDCRTISVCGAGGRKIAVR